MPNSENTKLTVQLMTEFVNKLEEEWNKIGIKAWTTINVSRCLRCKLIFASKTNRKYCSKKCQYNKKSD